MKPEKIEESTNADDKKQNRLKWQDKLPEPDKDPSHTRKLIVGGWA
jgi:hypothetical protein